MPNLIGLNTPPALVPTVAAAEDFVDPKLDSETVIEVVDELSLNVGTGLANDLVVMGVPITLSLADDSSETELSVTVHMAVSGPWYGAVIR